MIVRNQQQALSVAVEMERRAIKTYERALMVVTDEAVCQGVNAILRDEREHLRRFSEMRAQLGEGDAEERLMVQSMAAEVLFPGGLLEMNRESGLSTVLALYRFAAESEQTAVTTYTSFAEKCDDPSIAAAFLAIAREEGNHLITLKQRVQETEAT